MYSKALSSKNQPMRTAHLQRRFISVVRLPYSHKSVSRTSVLKPFSLSHSLPSFLPQTLTLVAAMASDSENLSTAAADDAKNGFTRPEMYKENLAGTVDAYDRHVFLCYKNHEAWPSRVEASDSDPLPKLIAATVKRRKDDITIKVCGVLCR